MSDPKNYSDVVNSLYQNRFKNSQLDPRTVKTLPMLTSVICANWKLMDHLPASYEFVSPINL